LQKFKKGALILAIQTGMPVVPVVVCGTYDVCVKGGRTISPCPLHVIIGKPIETEKMTYDDRDSLCDRLEAAVAQLKDQYAASKKLL
jgi:1-acyl-sn-glycerol-3-phosphate acyltransferase